jgi:hypothetical protein
MELTQEFTRRAIDHIKNELESSYKAAYTPNYSAKNTLLTTAS